MRTMMCAAIGLLYVLPATSHAEPGAKTISLIGQFEALHEQVVQDGFMNCPQRYRDAWTTNRLARLDALLEASGLGQLNSTHKKNLRDRVERKVLAGLNKACGTDKLPAALRAFRRATTDDIIHATIASYLGVAPPSGPAPRTLDFATSSSGAGQHVFAEKATIRGEMGGLASGNGFMDPGEWVQLGITLKNGAPRPWFSTSVYLSTPDKACLWVPQGEIEPGEFLEQDATQTIDIWLYMAPECPKNIRPTLHVRAVDSHRNREGVISTIRFSRLPALRASIVNLAIDTDEPGESTNYGSQRIKPGQTAEVSFGVNFNDNVADGTTVKVTMPSDQRPIFSKSELKAKLYRLNGNAFEVGDDLDLTSLSKKSYQQAQDRYAPSRVFFPAGQASGPLWLAIDIDAIQTTLDGKSGTKAKKDKSQNPMQADTAIALFKNFISFKSRQEQPRDKDAVLAVAGHDVIFDREAFTSAWNAANGISTSSSAGATGQGTLDNPMSEDGLMDSAPDTPARSIRRYVKLDMLRIAKERPKPVVRRVKRRPPRVVKKRRVIQLRPALFRLDVGTGVLHWGLLNDVENDTMVPFSTSVSIGRKWAFFGHFHRASADGTVTDFRSIDVPMEISESNFTAGVGYLISSNGRLIEFFPHAGVGFTWRSLTYGDEFDLSPERTVAGEAFDNSLTLDIGATLRLMPTKNVGFFVSIDQFIGSVSNEGIGQFYTGNAALFAVGLSIRAN